MNGVLINTKTDVECPITIEHDELPADRITFMVAFDDVPHTLYRRATDEMEWIVDDDDSKEYHLYVQH